MEKSPSDETEMMIKEPLLNSRKGGLRTMPFIIANEAFEKLASFGLIPNMVLYLTREYHMEAADGSNLLFFWSAASSFLPVLGALLADSFVGRFRMIGFGSIFSLLGMILLWATTMIRRARPPPCDEYSSSCSSSTTPQLILLCSSFVLMSIGGGGIRSSSMAFGADQLGKPKNLKSSSILESYFSWYYAAASFSIVVAMTCVVYVQEHLGWKVGFGVPVVLMFVSALSFFLASPFYIKLRANGSLLTGFVQVIVASFKNRHLALLSQSTDILYHHKKGSVLVIPSEKLRFLNKACIIRDPQQDLTPDGRSSDPWSLCTVDQVEELKALLKVIPLWSTGVIMSVNSNQPFQVLLVSSMDRHITSSFEIPTGSFSVFIAIAFTLWVALYDRVILPLASRIMGKPAHLTAKQRMGMGIFFSFLSMTVSAIIEGIRRGLASNERYSDGPAQAVVNMSALWLIPQLCLSGFGEALNIIAQNEFYYSVFPKSMSSIAVNVNGMGMSAASLLASFILSTIDGVTKRGGKASWVSSNVNEGHYDYYYWFLAGLSLFNMMYFLLCSWAYGPCEGEGVRVWNEEGEIEDE